jgi:hypothetical protein
MAISKKKGEKKGEKKVKKNKKKIENNEIIEPKIVPFYTKERWQNWIYRVKESNFKIDDHSASDIFVSMIDDVVLSCLKIIAKYDKGLLQKDQAHKFISETKEIVLKKIESINDDTDAMLASTQISLIGVFASCELYIDKNFESKKSFGDLINNALKAEEKNDMGQALNYVATVGANIISGEKLSEKDLDNIPEGFVAEWLDGIDSISVAMMGDTSYKEDEPDLGDQ